MTDVAPELLEAVSGRLERYMATDKELRPLFWAIQDGKANYQTVNKYAIRLGELLSAALRREISADKLPDGRMYYNIAERVLGTLLEGNHDMVAKAAMAAQNAMNASAGIGLKAVRPELNRSRVNGLIEKVSSYESYADAQWLMGEPVVNFAQSVVDDAIRVNVEEQARAGLYPTVTRIAEAGCCEWCAGLEGEYAYPVDSEIYRRHERCRCLVIYDPGKGKLQNAHTKVLYAEAARQERNARIARVLEIERGLSG